MEPRTPYPLDAQRVDEYLDDKRVLAVCHPPNIPTLSSPAHSPRTHIAHPYPTPRTSPVRRSASLNAPSVPDAPPFHIDHNQYDPLIQPALIKHEIVPSASSRRTIARARYESSRVIAGLDDRVLVIVGPCSIHNPEQALEYARRLRDALPQWPNLLIIMRSYFEKPRTTVGWKGLINDPDIDGSYKINKGLRIARQLLCDLTDLGVPVGLELLDTISPQYLADLVSWGAIGARTTESQLHRELASGSSFPIGFKNGTDGSVTVAVDAMRSAANPHAFMGVTTQGLAAIVKTRGNSDVHVILRGGSRGPNYASEHVRSASAAVKKARPDYHASVMVDCSHGNSQKSHLNQCKVVASICEQLAAGDTTLTGVMLESFLRPGKQDAPAATVSAQPATNGTGATVGGKVATNGAGEKGAQALEWGVSITDACIGWEETLELLSSLNEAVGQRRKVLQSQAQRSNGVNGSNHA